ncbi:hypothetical protein WAI453_000246 [Rhynchosporium graminicola]
MGVLLWILENGVARYDTVGRYGMVWPSPPTISTPKSVSIKILQRRPSESSHSTTYHNPPTLAVVSVTEYPHYTTLHYR